MALMNKTPPLIEGQEVDLMLLAAPHTLPTCLSSLPAPFLLLPLRMPPPPLLPLKKWPCCPGGHGDTLCHYTFPIPHYLPACLSPHPHYTAPHTPSPAPPAQRPLALQHYCFTACMPLLLTLPSHLATACHLLCFCCLLLPSLFFSCLHPHLCL